MLRPTLVNDFRFSYFFTSSSETPPESGIVPDAWAGRAGNQHSAGRLVIGSSFFDLSLERRFHFTDAITWQRSTHRVRFGVDWEHHRGGNLMWQNDPATITLFSPDQARQSNLPLPASFRTLDDILQLPLQSMTVALAIRACRRKMEARFAAGTLSGCISRTRGGCING